MSDGISTATAVGGFLVLLGGALFTLFRYVAATSDSVRKELRNDVCDVDKKIEATETRIESEVKSVRTEMDLKIEKVVAVQDRARHDDKNLLLGQFLKLEQAVNEIGKTAVRKEDMARMERTLDTLGEKIGRQAVLENQIGDLIKKLDKFEPMFTQLQSRGMGS